MGNATTKKSKIGDDLVKMKKGKEEKQKKKERKEAKAESKKKSKSSQKRSCAWERKLLQKQLYSTGFISHAVIADLEDSAILAVLPADFVPDQQGVRNIVDGLQGRLEGLEEHGVALGGGTGVFSPGKMDDENHAIYCTDGKGGCFLYKTKKCALIVICNDHYEGAMQVSASAAAYMIKEGRSILIDSLIDLVIDWIRNNY